MKTLVAWADPESPNLGVRVLAQGLRDALPRDWELRFVSHRSPLTSGPLLARRSLAAVVLPNATRRELAGYDLMIDVGEGDSFASIYGLRRLLRVASIKWASRRARVPVVLAPQTMGPWEGAAARAIARWSLRACDAAWARDSSSRQRCERYLTGRTHLASDLVFCLDPPQSSPSGGSGVSPVGLNISGLLWQPNNHVPHERYRQLVHGLLRHWQRAGTPVRLIAHVIAPGARDDDSACIEELVAQYENAEAVISADLAEVRASIAQCSLVVGARMHACLNALSLGVPTIPLAYSDKFRSLFADLAYPPGLDLRALPPGGLEPEGLLAATPTVDETKQARERGVERARAFIEFVVDRYA